MPKTYTLADKKVTDLMESVAKQWHGELLKHGVKIGVLMAYTDEGFAVTHGGYPAAAKIKAVPLKDRLTKEYDAELLIDSAFWVGCKEEHKIALMDHELSHIEVAFKDGEVSRDDLGRPKIKTVLGDWNGGDGFAAVVERHGEYAVEVENLRKVTAKVNEARNGLFQ